MKSLKIENNLETRKKILLSLFWTNRKAVRTEGCEPLLIKKIVTTTNTYTPTNNKLLKLTDDILEDIEKDIEADRSVEFEINIGEEFLKATIKNDSFSVSAQKNEVLEEEIIEKLELEMKRKYPNICQSFEPRVKS
jgi:hypothetical protein